MSPPCFYHLRQTSYGQKCLKSSYEPFPRFVNIHSTFIVISTWKLRKQPTASNTRLWNSDKICKGLPRWINVLLNLIRIATEMIDLWGGCGRSVMYRQLVMFTVRIHFKVKLIPVQVNRLKAKEQTFALSKPGSIFVRVTRKKVHTHRYCRSKVYSYLAPWYYYFPMTSTNNLRRMRKIHINVNCSRCSFQNHWLSVCTFR